MAFFSFRQEYTCFFPNPLKFRPQKANICFPCFVVDEATNREAVGLIVVVLWPDGGTVEVQAASDDTGVSAGGPEVAA